MKRACWFDDEHQCVCFGLNDVGNDLQSFVQGDIRYEGISYKASKTLQVNGGGYNRERTRFEKTKCSFVLCLDGRWAEQGCH